MPIVGPGTPGEIKYFFDLVHANGTNIQVSSTISPNTETLMDEAFQDLRDLFAGWDKVDPESPFYATKTVHMQFAIEPTEPVS